MSGESIWKGVNGPFFVSLYLLPSPSLRYWFVCPAAYKTVYFQLNKTSIKPQYLFKMNVTSNKNLHIYCQLQDITFAQITKGYNRFWDIYKSETYFQHLSRYVT